MHQHAMWFLFFFDLSKEEQMQSKLLELEADNDGLRRKTRCMQSTLMDLGYRSVGTDEKPVWKKRKRKRT